MLEMVHVVDYSTFANFVRRTVASSDLSSFKSHPDFTYMLEHVTREYGQEYLNCIRRNTAIRTQQIVDFCALNDSVGGPQMETYDLGDGATLHCSPTSLRYLYHAHLILTHYETLNLPNINLVEIGGGYGGLCLAIQFLRLNYRVALESYTIVDLKDVGELQSAYLAHFPEHTMVPVQFVDASTYGRDIEKSNMCLASCYSFSEIGYTHQSLYILHLFPRIKHGFIAWNHIPTYNFGFSFREEPEIPQTASKFNRYVYF